MSENNSKYNCPYVEKFVSNLDKGLAGDDSKKMRNLYEEYVPRVRCNVSKELTEMHYKATGGAVYDDRF